jgi:hypothetical protein
MKKAILGVTVLLMVLIAPVAALGHTHEGERAKVKIELPLTLSAPTADCPASTIVELDYRISWKGRSGTGRNCALEFDPVDCAPSVCVEVPVVMTFTLPGGTIEAQVTVFEKAPCGDPYNPNCARVEHTWSGTVTQATGDFEELQGGPVSGGGHAVYRVPPDPVEPFARLIGYQVIVGEPD